MKLDFLTLAIALFSLAVYSQSYSKETTKLWTEGEIPFNKKTITLVEQLGEEGKRYWQISEPELYVFRNNSVVNNGSALLVLPGGGYSRVTIGKNNGEGTAKHFLKMGFNVVAVLKYRLPDERIVNSEDKVPLCDAQKALSLISQNSDNWSVNKSKIAVLGSSAGGHLASSLANLTNPILAPDVKPYELKQAATILLYPVISFNLPYRHKGSYRYLLGEKSDNQALLEYYSMENQVSETTPQTFIIHATDDASVSYENSIIYCKSLKKFSVPYKYVELEKGGHGFGYNFNKTGIDWTIELKDWLLNETNLLSN